RVDMVVFEYQHRGLASAALRQPQKRPAFLELRANITESPIALSVVEQSRRQAALRCVVKLPSHDDVQRDLEEVQHGADVGRWIEPVESEPQVRTRRVAVDNLPVFLGALRFF